jgi:hypothetical protein
VFAVDLDVGDIVLEDGGDVYLGGGHVSMYAGATGDGPY